MFVCRLSLAKAHLSVREWGEVNSDLTKIGQLIMYDKSVNSDLTNIAQIIMTSPSVLT